MGMCIIGALFFVIGSMDQFLEFVGNHLELVGLFVALLVALIVVESRRGGKNIGPQDLVRMINRDEAVVIDVREKKDLAEGIIADSIHVPYTSIKERAEELRKHAGKTIVVVDKMGQHSGAAVKLLKAAGIENVMRLQGGVTEWKNATLPLKSANSKNRKKA